MPAMFMTMPAVPWAAAAASSAATRLAESVMSVMSAVQARPPMSPATRSALAVLTSITVTRAPRLASSRATASPSPEPPPVTMALCPWMFMLFLSDRFLLGAEVGVDDARVAGQLTGRALQHEVAGLRSPVSGFRSPTTRARLATPSAICSPAWRQTSKPVPQMCCTLSAGTACRTPLYRPLWRATQNRSKPPDAVLPVITESTSPASTPAPASTLRAAWTPRSIGLASAKAPW